MNIAKYHKAITAALDAYRTRLDDIPDEQFTETPPGGGWSYAEVYAHILQSDLGSTIAMERCINGTCEPTGKGLNFIGRLVLAIGRMPVSKVKATDEKAAVQNVNKISKEDARNLLVKCHKRVDDITVKLSSSVSQKRYPHPRFGTLNAWQWLKFILIHTKHHFKQLDRIRKKFLRA